MTVTKKLDSSMRKCKPDKWMRAQKEPKYITKVRKDRPRGAERTV